MNNLTPPTGNPPLPFTANTSQTAEVPFPLSPTLYSPKGSDTSQRLVFLSSPEDSEVNNLTDKLKTAFTSGITTPQDQEKTNKNPSLLTPITTTPQKINTDRIAKRLDFFYYLSDSSPSFLTDLFLAYASPTLELQQIKNCRGLAIHADDSSDEDEVKEKQAKYDIALEWNRFSVEKLETINDQYGVSDFTVRSSFITHTKGIGLLYNSPMVHQLYYQYKETFLASVSNDLYNAMQKEIVDSIKSTLRSIIKTNYRLSLQYDDLSGFVDAKFSSEEEEKKAIENKIEELIKSVLEKFNPCLGGTTSDILNFRSRIWREKGTFFFEKLTNLLHKLLENRLTTDPYIKEAVYRSPVPLPNQKEEIEVSSKFTGMVINNALEVGKKEGYLRQEGNVFKTPLKIVKINYTPKKVNNLFTQKVEEIAYNKNEDSGVAETVFKKIHNIQSLTQGCLQQLIKQDQKTKYKGSPDSPVWKTAQIEENLKQYLHVSPERIQKELEILLTENLAAKLKTISDNFKDRRTLPLQKEFKSQNAIEYLANIRLSNRSQRRSIRNLHQGSLTKKTLYLPLDNKTILTNQRLWQFNNGGSALENQSITSNLGRSDTVTNGGSYQFIFKQLEEIKKNEVNVNGDVTDQIIAQWIRKNIKGEDLQVKTLLPKIPKSEEAHLLNIIANVTFLLFGCEAARSPASLVVNQMILDLIIAEKFLGRMRWYVSLN